jgi:DNA-binding HxlR family transcriptional regulator
MRKPENHSVESCNKAMIAVKDALYVLNGKWKLPIILGLSNGPLRFKELQRTVDGITARILSKELKELEMNEFVTRTVYDTAPVTVEYALTSYADTLDDVIQELYRWGSQHRERIFSKSRLKRELEVA